MFFSLISINPGYERDAAHQRASGPYAEHQWLWRFFPANVGTPRDYVFRRIEQSGLPRFYVVSKRSPRFVDDAWQVQTREYAPQLTVGTRLHFELRANPIVTTKAGGKTARHDVVMQEKKRLLAERGLTRWQDWHDGDKPSLHLLVTTACGKWLSARGEHHGFSLDQDTVAVEAYEQHAEKRGTLKFSTVDFQGELTVTNPDAFTDMLYNGLGHAKAFGCGLMLVRRAA